jgi:hypothetical protein
MKRQAAQAPVNMPYKPDTHHRKISKSFLSVLEPMGSSDSFFLPSSITCCSVWEALKYKNYGFSPVLEVSTPFVLNPE